MTLTTRTIGIYCIQNKLTGDYYVGSSVDIGVRWSVHKAHLRRGKHHSPILQHAWNKYGESNFEFRVVEECEREELTAREQEYLTYQKGKYNLADEALHPMLGRKHSEETKEKMRAAAMGNKRNFGNTLSAETRAKISAGNRGKIHGTGPGVPRPPHVIAAMQAGRARQRATLRGER